MKITEVMTEDVECLRPADSIAHAAERMRKLDVGSLPVCGDEDKLVGMITDRDIAIRAVAQGKGPDTPVRDVMSTEQVLYCYEDEELDHVAKNMGSEQVRRLPVVNRDKRLVGIVSFGDVAQTEARSASKAVKGVTKPGAQHNQSH